MDRVPAFRVLELAAEFRHPEARLSMRDHPEQVAHRLRGGPGCEQSRGASLRRRPVGIPPAVAGRATLPVDHHPLRDRANAVGDGRAGERGRVGVCHQRLKVDRRAAQGQGDNRCKQQDRTPARKEHSCQKRQAGQRQRGSIRLRRKKPPDRNVRPRLQRQPERPGPDHIVMERRRGRRHRRGAADQHQYQPRLCPDEQRHAPRRDRRPGAYRARQVGKRRAACRGE